MRRLILVLLCACSGSMPGDPEPGATPDASVVTPGDAANVCLMATEQCETTEQCCDDLECGTTTLGQVCCGQDGATCATENGEDCCGDLLCINGKCGLPDDAMFEAPFRCNEQWTYSHHSQEVRLALDFVRNDGGTTNGAPVLASAAGVASRRYQAGGAGNYIVIDHGGGWTTYYFHLQAYSVADGAQVAQGQEIGLTGTTGASSGPHIHYEQLLNGVGQTIKIRGQSLAPYPGTYGSKSIISKNACPP